MREPYQGTGHYYARPPDNSAISEMYGNVL